MTRNGLSALLHKARDVVLGSKRELTNPRGMTLLTPFLGATGHSFCY